MIEFKEKKQKHERSISVKELSAQLIEQDPDNVIIISWNDGDLTHTGWSANNNYEVVARCEVAKQHALDDIVYFDED